MGLVERAPTHSQVWDHLQIDVLRDQAAVDQLVDLGIGRQMEVVRIERGHFRRYADCQIGRRRAPTKRRVCSHRTQPASHRYPPIRTCLAYSSERLWPAMVWPLVLAWPIMLTPPDLLFGGGSMVPLVGAVVLLRYTPSDTGSL